jgi:hypothetical protein
MWCNLVQFLVELVELGRFGHDIFVHEKWGLNLLIFSLPQKIKTVRNQGLIEIDSVIN